jgi:hypothetical protein
MTGLLPHCPRVRSALVVVALVLMGAPSARAQAPETLGKVEAQCNILVMDLTGKALAEDEADLPSVLTEALVGEVSEVSRCQVISEADITSMMQFEATKASCGGELDSCLAEIGAAFGAERVVSGTVARLGSEYLLTARLLDVQRGSVEGRAEQTIPDKGGLRVGAKNLGRTLFEVEPLPADATPSTAAPAPSAEEGGMSLSLLGGVGLASAGALLAVGGGALTGVAELRMSDPAASDKDQMQLLGLAGLGGAGVGALVALGGGVLLAVAMVE